MSLNGAEGDVIAVGKMLCEVEVDGGSEEAQTESLPPAAPQAPTATTESSSSDAVPAPPTQLGEKPQTVSVGGSKEVWATPATRRVAREHNIDLSQVTGTGPKGRVLKGDVLNFVSNGSSSTAAASTQSSPPPPPPASRPAQPPASSTTVPLSPIRKAMYRAMTASLQIPHFSYSESIDVTNLERLRLRLNKDVPLRYRKTLKPADEQHLARMQANWGGSSELDSFDRVAESARFDRLTMLPLLVKALSLSMYEHPLFTCSLDAPSPDGPAPPAPSTLTRRPSHDISIALSAPSGGLFTPCLPAVDTRGAFSIASQIASLQSIASSTSSGAPKFPDEHKRPGTITLSNVGVIGGTTTHPVVPPTGQLAIGALGRTRAEPRYVQSEQDRAKRIAKGEEDESVLGELKTEPRLIMVSSRGEGYASTTAADDRFFLSQ